MEGLDNNSLKMLCEIDSLIFDLRRNPEEGAARSKAKRKAKTRGGGTGLPSCGPVELGKMYKMEFGKTWMKEGERQNYMLASGNS